MLERKVGALKPAYLSRFETLITDYAQFGGGASGEKYVQAKSFSNVYEFYIYAYFLGLKCDSRMEILASDESKSFYEIDNWKPKDLVDCLIVSGIAESDFDMVRIEHMDDRAISDEVAKLRRTLEGYANGGFDLIAKRAIEDPDSMSDDRFFINLLAENQVLQS
jgi:hypothetical protein